MNRIQFFILIGLSSIVVLLLLGHIYLVRKVGIDQAILNQAQQRVNQGQSYQSNLKQLAVRIYQDSQKTQDQGLKDLLARQQITYNPTPEGASAPDSSSSTATAPAPAH
jgi:hypothetical protein